MPQPKEYGSNSERQAAYRRRQSAAQATLVSTKGLMPLPKVAGMPGLARWRQLLEQAEVSFRAAFEQMQAYYDERSDPWLESDKAETFSERMEAIEELLDHITDCKNLFNQRKIES